MRIDFSLKLSFIRLLFSPNPKVRYTANIYIGIFLLLLSLTIHSLLDIEKEQKHRSSFWFRCWFLFLIFFYSIFIEYDIVTLKLFKGFLFSNI